MARTPIPVDRPFTGFMDPHAECQLAVVELEDHPSWLADGDVPVLVIPRTAEAIDRIGRELTEAVGRVAAVKALKVLGLEVAP